tara:strand:- start:5126 stop:5653 length:528 start_codon:yes stop_codon:yes gene_type:complete
VRFYRFERRPEKHQLPDLVFGLDAQSEKVARGCAVIASIREFAFAGLPIAPEYTGCSAFKKRVVECIFKRKCVLRAFCFLLGIIRDGIDQILAKLLTFRRGISLAISPRRRSPRTCSPQPTAALRYLKAPRICRLLHLRQSAYQLKRLRFRLGGSSVVGQWLNALRYSYSDLHGN